MWPVFTKKKKKSFRPLYSQISSRRVCTWICCPISAYCPPPHPTPLLLDGRSPSPLAECSTFRGLYKTKLWAPSQQQTHLCSCGSIKERRPILCRFLWLASLTKAFLCVRTLWQGLPTLRSSFSATSSCSEDQRKKIINWFIEWFFLGRLKYKFIRGLAVNKGSLLAARMRTAQGLLYIFLWLWHQVYFDWIFTSFVWKRKWNPFAFSWVSLEMRRNSSPSFNGG